MKVREFFKSAKSGGQLVICSALVAALLVSCEKNSEIKVYRVSKAPLEQSAPQQQDAMPTNTTAPRMPAGLPPAIAGGLMLILDATGLGATAISGRFGSWGQPAISVSCTTVHPYGICQPNRTNFVHVLTRAEIFA